jgi:Uma2 family endonuclease
MQPTTICAPFQRIWSLSSSAASSTLIRGRRCRTPGRRPAWASIWADPSIEVKVAQGGWILLDEPELHLHGDVLVPDLAGWRRERVPEMPRTPAFELAPDWVCEVLSPATEAVDRTDKMVIYAREQVRHVWLVDPMIATHEVFRLLNGKTYEAVAAWRGEVKVRAEPFDAIELELAAIWER